MKILAVSQFYTPDITAASFRISETVSHLQEMGNELEVITTYPHKSKVKKEDITDEDNVHRVKLPETENKGFLGYIYVYLSFMIKSIIAGYKVGRKFSPDVVWASSPPIFVGLSGWVLARLLGSRFALDIRDIWPDSAVAAGQLSGSGFAYSIGRWMERFIYTHADVITCVATPMQQYIQQFTDTPVDVIYNGVEVSSLNGKEESKDYDRLKNFSTNKDSKKILYAGNFGHVQQLELLITAYSSVDGKGLAHSWEIFFLGAGAQKDNLQRLVRSCDLTKKIHFLDPVPKEKVFAYLKSADVLFIHLMDSEVLRLTIPSKVFDYMLANKPLLAGIHGEGKKIIDNASGNITFGSGVREQLEQAIEVMDKEILVYSKKMRNAETVVKHYSRESQSKKLNQIFKSNFGN